MAMLNSQGVIHIYIYIINIYIYTLEYELRKHLYNWRTDVDGNIWSIEYELPLIYFTSSKNIINIYRIYSLSSIYNLII